MNLNQITIQVQDIEKSIAFYEKLGLQLIVHSQEHYARFECENQATFSLHKTAEKLQNSTWIYFETEDLDLKVTHLQQIGFTFEELPTDKPWLWKEARLRDPDNHLIILYFAGENRLNPPWKL